MPRKLAMARDAYFSAQQVYLGWALFGIPILAKIVLDVALAYSFRGREPGVALAFLASAILIATGLLFFFLFVQPANLATSSWSNVPANWSDLRSSWEHGHAAIALLTLAAFAASSFGALPSQGR